MKKYTPYKIAIWVLSLLVIFEGLFIITVISKKAVRIKPAPIIKGEIAIVIDDWGYNLNNLYILNQMRYPLTLSVLPNLNYSSRVCQEAHKRGFEIVLHLPMEPYEKFRLEQNTIMISMDESKISNIIKQGLASVCYARGVSNHMGSKATEHQRTMDIFFRELKKRHLYFLDSMVSSKTLGSILAKNLGVHFVRRDVFLDNIEEYAYIRGQINKLKKMADAHGKAVGIGHDRRITLEVLKEAMPEIEKEGYKFVFVSDLVR